jgi:arylsulfatase A-like enzyme
MLKNILTSTTLFTIPLVFLSAGIFATPLVGSDKPVNIVLILADDMGYSDLSSFGSEIRTPNTARLAAEGVSFTRAYNMAQCQPTRVTLMTGQRNTPRIAFTGEKSEIWLADLMKQAGYTTKLSGKWHVSGHPLDRGFDAFFGMEEGVCDYFTGSERLQRGRQSYQPGEGFYSTDAFTDEGIDFMRRATATGQPFFLYLAYTAPHDPLQAPIEDIERYRGVYDVGWHAIQDQRFNRLRDQGLISPQTRKPEWPLNLPRWEELSPAQQRLEALRMEVYAAMVDRMDQNIGRVLLALEELGQLNNTMIILLSDNGANPFEAGRQDRMLRQGIRPDDPRSQWSTGPAWAHVSNTPFRMYKRNLHEGGIRTPMILSGPGLGYAPGEITALPVHVLDFLPTFLAWANASEQIPAEAEGSDLSRVFQQGIHERPDFAMIDSHFEHRLVYEAGWKLVSAEGRPWELYRLSEDPTETRDMAGELPEIVKRLERSWYSDWRQVSGEQRFTPLHRTGPRARMYDRDASQRYEPLSAPEGW